MSYTSRAQLVNLHGEANLAKWSALGGESTANETRISAALLYGDAQVDLRLIGGAYALPLQGMDSTTEISVDYWATVFAAHWLYFSRGMLDKDEQAPKLDDERKRVEEEITQVRSGKLRLNARRRWAPNPNCPTAS
jgi:hypothetical protein